MKKKSDMSYNSVKLSKVPQIFSCTFNSSFSTTAASAASVFQHLSIRPFLSVQNIWQIELETSPPMPHLHPETLGSWGNGRGSERWTPGWQKDNRMSDFKPGSLSGFSMGSDWREEQQWFPLPTTQNTKDFSASVRARVVSVERGSGRRQSKCLKCLIRV